MLDKVNYFLRTFPSKEWSGPAWYFKSKSTEEGFPEDFQLMDFHPLDLGDTSSTEWDSDDFAKILKKKYKANKDLKKCYIGLLHSHHTMGAFFSGTDTNTLEEMAPKEGFYPSLVVSTKADKQFAFGFSYLDQYGKISIFKDEEIELAVPSAKDEWKEIAKKIKAEAKTTAITTHYPRNGYQGSFGWGSGYNGYDNDVILDEETLQKGKDIWSKFKNPQNSMSHAEMNAEMKKIGVDNPHGVFSGTGFRY
jgi:proteasome lid subunit RPN8/RPN11